MKFGQEPKAKPNNNENPKNTKNKITEMMLVVAGEIVSTVIVVFRQF